MYIYAYHYIYMNLFILKNIHLHLPRVERCDGRGGDHWGPRHSWDRDRRCPVSNMAGWKTHLNDINGGF